MPELHDSPVFPGCFSLWGERDVEPIDALPPDDFDDEDEEDW